MIVVGLAPVRVTGESRRDVRGWFVEQAIEDAINTTVTHANARVARRESGFIVVATETPAVSLLVRGRVRAPGQPWDRRTVRTRAHSTARCPGHDRGDLAHSAGARSKAAAVGRCRNGVARYFGATFTATDALAVPPWPSDIEYVNESGPE